MLSILLFPCQNTAFIGTTGATFIIGVLQWGFGQAGICFQMPFLYNLVSVGSR
jgi:hypothetical protein